MTKKLKIVWIISITAFFALVSWWDRVYIPCLETAAEVLKNRIRTQPVAISTNFTLVAKI